ncbi:MAG: hypothetical protein VBE63_08210 [Lamprobacter sp.]|uniref:hypothetical protein n=1 Tax=Lamprobacter sp. TaxID=3100796 RepID=UPI002B25D746|nr:hypothetical protein [Lamprobacter sp.]MEA3639912.1 hypothetical protein [Lamprobacter sp.]
MKIVIDQCSGIAPRTPPARLSAEGAQIARNVDVRRQTLQPLRAASSLAVTLPSGTKTIYKWGGTLSERVWFAWSTDVDVCRGQIAGDDLEWTIFTGDGYPKITNANMYGLSEPPEPAPYDPYEPPDLDEPTGSTSFSEVYSSYVRVFDSIHAGASTLRIIIAPLEDAFALASGPVSISGGAIATTEPVDLSGLNAAINGTYNTLSALESAVLASLPSSYGGRFGSTYLGRVFTVHHGAYGPVGEEITVGSPFTVTWGS